MEADQQQGILLVAQRIKELGVQLEPEAISALAGLPQEHALELLETVGRRLQTGGLQNPSRFIAATVAKGYVPNATYQANLGEASKDTLLQSVGPSTVELLESITQGLGLPPALAQAGVDLNTDALNALARLPPDHAAELLEFVVKKRGELRDPSNYILSTIARGFVSRKNPQSNVAAAATPATLDLSAAADLNPEAVQALQRIPPEHAAELLEYVSMKKHSLRDPSNYVLSTISRGFVSRKRPGIGGATLVGVGDQLALGAAGSTGSGDDLVAAEDACAHAVALAQTVGLQLSSEAANALSGMEPTHAAELLEFVARRKDQLRDPSTYVLSTIARGYVSRKSGSTATATAAPVATNQLLQSLSDLASQLPGLVGASMPTGTPDLSLVPLDQGSTFQPSAAMAADMGAELYLSNPELCPPDISPVERRCLRVNAMGLLGGQQVDIESLLALRCLPEEQALELLERVQDKLSAGATNVGNLNTYLRAAITKIREKTSTPAPLAALPAPAPALPSVGGVDLNSLMSAVGSLAASIAGSGGQSGLDIKGLAAAASAAANAAAGLGTGAGAAPADPGLPALNLTGNKSAERARELGLELNTPALQALASIPLTEAMQLLTQAASRAQVGEDPSQVVLDEALQLASSASLDDSSEQALKKARIA